MPTRFFALIFFLIFCISLFSYGISYAEVRLASDNATHFPPQWSPSGEFILYQKVDVHNNLHLYKIASSGGPEIPLASEEWISYYYP